MVLTCECCPCSRFIVLRVVCIISSFTLAFTWWTFVLSTATEEYAFYKVNNITGEYTYTPYYPWYTTTFQDWYILFGTIFWIVMMLSILFLTIFWFCWNEGTRCFTNLRERIVLIVLTVVLVISVVWVVPAIVLRNVEVQPGDDYVIMDSDIVYVLYSWTILLGLCGGGCLVAIWYQNCKKKKNVTSDTVIYVLPSNQYIPPVVEEDTVLPWNLKKSEITNNWEHVGKYYRKSIDDTNKKFSSFIHLFFEMGGNDIIVKEIFAVHNPTLFDQFNNRRKVMLDRQKEDPETWCSHQWSAGDHQKEWVYESYQNLVKRFKWNEKSELPIIPVLHGTDEDIAWKICRSGFAALARLDAGWYGAGNYFSTNAMYCFPYFGTKTHPALILSFVVPGNVYPVTESKDGPDSLLGKPIRKKCGSHYALVTKDGNVCKQIMERDYFTEIVVEQEAQILPCFVFLVDTKNFSKLAEIYKREIPTN